MNRPDGGTGLRLWRQLGLGLLLFGCYLLVDSVGGVARRSAALAHGRDLVALERTLHLDIEGPLNRALAPHHTLSTLANYEYATTYIVSALVLLAWLWARRRDLWRPARDSFIVLNLLAIATFWLYPVAPPRMLGDLGFVDTVSRGRTIGSWGSGLVDTANQLAAMPSLHVGWALWVSVVLARITARRSVQVLSAVHVLLTVYVVVATANHYVLDALAVVVPVALGQWYADLRHGGPPGEPIAACDAFFLHVEASTGAAQHVGGFIDMGTAAPSMADLRELARTELQPQRRFHQIPVGSGRWRRSRWVDTEVDIDRHVFERPGATDLRSAVAELAATPLGREIPMWRLILVRDGHGRAAVVFLVHHSMADGIATITHSLRLFRPRVDLLEGVPDGPGPVRTIAAATVGLAQLATDGPARPLAGSSPGRAYATAHLDLGRVRAVAAARAVHVTDLVLALLAESMHRTHPDLAARLGGSMRVSVPLMVGAAGDTLEGNATATVMIDVPVDDRGFEDRLAEVARRTHKLRVPTRAIASRFVMATALRALPEPAAAWFARTVYGGRFFHGIASNLPGPPALLTLTGRPVAGVYPILPLAPGAPFALGAMSWGPAYGWGLAADPALIDAAALTAGVEAVFSDPGSRPLPRLPRQRRGPDSDPDRSASPTRRPRRPAADRSGC